MSVAVTNETVGRKHESGGGRVVGVAVMKPETWREVRAQTRPLDPRVSRGDATDSSSCCRSPQGCPLRRLRQRGRAASRDDPLPAMQEVVLPLPVVLPGPAVLPGFVPSRGSA